MAKKKATKKRTAKKVAPKADVNKTQEIKKVLAAMPNKPPKQISDELIAKGIDVSPGYVSTIKTNMKAEKGSARKVAKKKAAPKKKATAKKKTSKKKVARKKRAPKATPTGKITYDQLRMAKDLAQ